MKSFVFIVMLVCLTGCNAQNPATQERPELQTTISADGQMVAVMQNQYTDKLRVRFKRLDQEHEWEDLPVPPHTTGIHFGLTGHQLLLTYRKAAEGTASDLVKWDLDAYQKTKAQPVHIYSSTGMDFPIEVAPSEYLVRTCPPTPEDKCHRYFSVWHQIYKDGRVHKYTNERRTNYGTPNIVPDQGFFWREWIEKERDPLHPSIRSIAFPNKTAPTFDTSQMDKDTHNFVCDYKVKRCLRSFVSNPRRGEDYVYDLEVFLETSRCAIQGVAGVGDGDSITPDGNSAVMSLANKFGAPRHVVVMRFKPQQCEPISVQHINF